MSVDMSKIFSDKEKLEGSQNLLVWSFKMEQILRKEKCWMLFDKDVIVLGKTKPNADALEELREKGIILITSAVHNCIIPILRKFKLKPADLWAELITLAILRVLLLVRWSIRMSFHRYG